MACRSTSSRAIPKMGFLAREAAEQAGGLSQAERSSVGHSRAVRVAESRPCRPRKNFSNSPTDAPRSSSSTASCGTCRRSPTPRSSAKTNTRRCCRPFTRTSCSRPWIFSGRSSSSSRLRPRSPKTSGMLIVELADNHARHVWLQQEGAYHVGLAVGHRLRLRSRNAQLPIPTPKSLRTHGVCSCSLSSTTTSSPSRPLARQPARGLSRRRAA